MKKNIFIIIYTIIIVFYGCSTLPIKKNELVSLIVGYFRVDGTLTYNVPCEISIINMKTKEIIKTQYKKGNYMFVGNLP